jgi:hypothetical protein
MKTLNPLIVAVTFLCAAHVNAADWRTAPEGWFYTASTLTQGTVITIRVASGKFDQVRLWDYYPGPHIGPTATLFQGWTNVIPGQVLSSYTVPRNANIGIDTANPHAKTTSVTHQGNIDQLTFDPGWSLQVKIDPPPWPGSRKSQKKKQTTNNL